MARLFRSKSCTLSRITAAHSIALDSTSPPSPSLFQNAREDDSDEEEEDDDNDDDEGYFGNKSTPVTTPFIGPEERSHRDHNGAENKATHHSNQYQFPILALLGAALRKSLVTCSVERDDVANMDIGWPTEVRHVSHVTFDPFNGFLGLPVELQPDVPCKVPSASVSVFGVSPQSMQCSYDYRRNSVPTILLMLQNRLYSESGLRAEGIFRINAENSQEQHVRNQLNKGVVPCRIDVHCMAGLIKAWFRELPTGVLDSLTPEQVMHCNTEEECTKLVNLLPKTEAGLLDWAINLMADVVEQEHFNKMNARNIAMVFAPNMTQMGDPLTALVHAVQVMNFLKTLINKMLREREESGGMVGLQSLVEEGLWGNDGDWRESGNVLVRSGTESVERVEGENYWRFRGRRKSKEECEGLRKRFPGVVRRRRQTLGCKFRDGYESEEEAEERMMEKRRSLRKVYKHPVFQLSKGGKEKETSVNTK